MCSMNSNAPSLTGGCLCGAVRFTLDGPVDIVNYCHCSRCRRRSGSAFATIVHARWSDFEFVSGEEQIVTFEPEGWNLRRFCGGCGSPLPGWDEEDDEVGIPAGLFDGDISSHPDIHIMVGSKAPWYEIQDNLPQHDEFPEEW